jgi:hypothetical protein
VLQEEERPVGDPGEARVVELRDRVVEVELLEELPPVGAEPGEVVPEVRRRVGRVDQGFSKS